MNRFTQPRFLFWLLTYTGLALVVAYGYFINGSIFLLVTNEGVIKDTEAVREEVIDLEGHYLVLSSRLTMETAQQLGFYDASQQTTFVNLAQNNLVVFNTPR